MSGFLKLLRPEKVAKIAKEIYKSLEEKGQQVSIARMSVDLLSLQAEQDPIAVKAKIEELGKLSSEVDKEAGLQTLISLYLKQFEISVTFTQKADFELSEKMTLELIEETKKYFEGNEIAENYVDPYMILASIYL